MAPTILDTEPTEAHPDGLDEERRRSGPQLVSTITNLSTKMYKATNTSMVRPLSFGSLTWE
ncbi:hypothetical protein Pst134EA_031731 [Puccinia striiformis f. sp. tritici]|uniref:uncharacterized protein n=1 Tax=Puccinia striiformis f. sp. tritici TaxID=168172 RepID=UPI002008B923|nr:uncharacterized protein Pst134EA_031731 [Puccinia striiformis f. sp. tritici]KAH9442616.1 hypothetical protein Pst134EA_031731 [Puccinia striiformis f. sp. tritici]